MRYEGNEADSRRSYDPRALRASKAGQAFHAAAGVFGTKMKSEARRRGRADVSIAWNMHHKKEDIKMWWCLSKAGALQQVLRICTLASATVQPARCTSTGSDSALHCQRGGKWTALHGRRGRRGEQEKRLGTLVV